MGFISVEPVAEKWKCVISFDAHHEIREGAFATYAEALAAGKKLIDAMACFL